MPPLVIARNALLQEESEEFSGDFQDPINIHIENDRDSGCACSTRLGVKYLLLLGILHLSFLIIFVLHPGLV
jgi:hypothetical protein